MLQVTFIYSIKIDTILNEIRLHRYNDIDIISVCYLNYVHKQKKILVLTDKNLEKLI